MAKKKRKTPAPKPTQRFVVVVNAVAELTIEAPSAAAAVSEYKKRFKANPRIRGKGVAVQLLSDGAPIVLDAITGERTTTGSPKKKRAKRTKRQAWNSPPPERSIRSS